MEKIVKKRVLVTGGTTGIGKAVAKILVENGARVVIFSRTKEKLENALEELKPLGEIYGLNADVAFPEDIKKVFEFVDKNLNGLDVLINNAGESGGTIVGTDQDQTEYILDVNLGGYVKCAKEAIKRMEKNKQGIIINIGSLSAQTRDAGSDIYVATKSGINGFSESLRRQISDTNIKVTLIEPGAVATPLHGLTNNELKELVQKEEMLRPEDIANAVYYILTQPWIVDIPYLSIKPRKQNI